MRVLKGRTLPEGSSAQAEELDPSRQIHGTCCVFFLGGGLVYFSRLWKGDPPTLGLWSLDHAAPGR